MAREDEGGGDEEEEEEEDDEEEEEEEEEEGWSKAWPIIDLPGRVMNFRCQICLCSLSPARRMNTKR